MLFKKIYESNFIKQQSETVMIKNTKMLIAVLKNKRTESFIAIFGTFVPYYRHAGSLNTFYVKFQGQGQE